MDLDIKRIENLTVEDVHSDDIPDFVDAFFGSGNFKESGDELTDLELQELTDKYPEVVNEMAHEEIMS